MQTDDSITADTESETRRSNRILLIGLAVATMLVLLGLWYASRPAPVPLQGLITAEEVSVATKAFARVVSLAVEEGDQVRKGEILGELSSPARDLLVNQGEASLITADALNEMTQQGARLEDIAALRQVSLATAAAANLGAVTARRMNRLYDQGVVSAQKARRGQRRAQSFYCQCRRRPCPVSARLGRTAGGN